MGQCAMAVQTGPSGLTGEWTDSNVHDPGITLLEVLVFVVVATIGVAIVRKRRRRADDHVYRDEL